MKASTGRKLRYGGTSLALTAAIIAVVVILNVMFTLLVQRYGLYVDLTPDLHFTISDECFDLIGKVDATDGMDSPIEMVEKFRKENDALTAQSKKDNAEIAKHNESAKKNNDAINELLGKDNDKYVAYEAYKPYKEYVDYTYDTKDEIAKIAAENTSIRKENNRIKIKPKWK